MNRTKSFVYGGLYSSALCCSPLPIRLWRIGSIIRASDKKCLVVDIEPIGKDKSITKIGKQVYLTREEAEADVKRLCKQ